MHKYLSEKSPLLRTLIAEIGPLELPIPDDIPLSHALMRSIAHQQLHGKAAESILNRFLDMFGGAYPTPAQLLKTKDGTIRATGFSASKIAALRDIAVHAENGVIPDRAEAVTLSDDELIARLTKIRGVGRWTVEMLLIFNLGRKDVLPIDDFGVLNGYRIIAGLDAMPARKDFATIGEDWAPYRSLVSLYLWRAADKAKEKTQAQKAEARAAAKAAAAVAQKPKGIKPVKMTEAEKAAAKAARLAAAETKAAPKKPLGKKILRIKK